VCQRKAKDRGKKEGGGKKQDSERMNKRKRGARIKEKKGRHH